MAVTIEKLIDESRIGYALVNNILQFNKGSALNLPNATLEFDSKLYVLRPAPDGTFWYNMIDILSVYAGRFGYIDDLDYNVDTLGVYYDWTDRALVRGAIIIKFFNPDGSLYQTITNNVYLLNGIIQIEEHRKRLPYVLGKTDTLAMTPLSFNSNSSAYVKYWTGYPFDIGVHKESNSSFSIINNENTGVYNVTSSNIVDRFFISDGRTISGIETALQLIEGVNNLTLISSNGKQFTLYLDKKTPANNCGVYVKWINSQGLYSYWLFDLSERNRNSNDLGYIDNDFFNIEDTYTPRVNIGKVSADSIKVSVRLNEDQKPLFMEIFDSPAIWLFTGRPYDKNTVTDWLSVSLKTTTNRLKDYKRNQTNLDLVFELPNRYTRKT